MFREVYLTFDVSKGYYDRINVILKYENVKQSCFLWGAKCKKNVYHYKGRITSCNAARYPTTY